MDMSWLENEKEIGFDIETKDPYVGAKGPGVYRKDGYVVGIALASKDKAVYLDIAHPDTSAEAKERNLRIAKTFLAKPTVKVGANIMYDLDWTINGMGIHVAGPYEDVQFAEPLLDEYRQTYSLSALAKEYGEEEKASGLLDEYCNQQGWKFKDAREHVWKMPAKVVAKYAELDGMLPLRIIKKQREAMERQGLMDIYRVECGLLPLLVQMRKQGVRIDMDKLKKTSLAVADKSFELQNELYEWAGQEFDIASSAQLAKVLDKKGIAYPRNAPTEFMKAHGRQGNPNLDKESLTRMIMKGVDPHLETVLRWRHYNTLTSMFLLPYYDFIVDGRLHCLFNPLRSDSYGAVSGRFSSSKPNLQQVSAQSDDMFSGGSEGDLLEGQILRKLFIPEEGHLWAKLDQSQVEYRIGAHYAIGPGSEELRQAYVDNPLTDYHQHIQDITGFDRRTAKRLNFGASYGMGAEAASRKFYWSIEEATMFMEAYHKAAPHLKLTRKKVVEKAAKTGYIYTLLGRRARVHPSRKLHSLYNRLIQGTAADIMKKGMVDAYEAGLFNVLPPHITVHDEIDVSVPPTKIGEEALKELKRILEECVTLRVPLVVDCHKAVNWAEAD